MHTKAFQTMAHYNTVLSQMTNVLPGHQFHCLLHQHTLDQRTSRWIQFMSLLAAQLVGWSGFVTSLTH